MESLGNYTSLCLRIKRTIIEIPDCVVGPVELSQETLEELEVFIVHNASKRVNPKRSLIVECPNLGDLRICGSFFSTILTRSTSLRRYIRYLRNVVIINSLFYQRVGLEQMLNA